MKQRTDKELLTLWEEYKAAHPPELTEVEKLRAKNDVLKTLIEDKDRENKNALFEIYGMLIGGKSCRK